MASRNLSDQPMCWAFEWFIEYVQVFVSSTYTDLKEERKTIIESLLNATYIPAGMEMFSASNDEQFEYIKKIIDTCDYYVLIVAARYGTINPTTGISFTEQEYDYAVSKNIPVLAFLHNNPYNLPFDKRDDDKKEFLEAFRAKVSKNRTCKMWDNMNGLVNSVIISLNDEKNKNPQLGWIRGSYYNAEITKLIDASLEQGLEMLYGSRTNALLNFTKFIYEEKDEIVVVGTSLEGVFRIIDFESMVKDKPNKFKFLLIDPSFTELREKTEKLAPGVIRSDIERSISKLIQCRFPLENIKLYQGSPTVFMLLTSKHMLLNPYAYCSAGYHSFTIQVGKGPIYDYYRQKHYLEIWNDDKLSKKYERNC